MAAFVAVDIEDLGHGFDLHYSTISWIARDQRAKGARKNRKASSNRKIPHGVGSQELILAFAISLASQACTRTTDTRETCRAFPRGPQACQFHTWSTVQVSSGWVCR